MSSVMNARKSRYTHGWIKDEDMVKIEDHIDDLMYIRSEHTYGKIYDKIKNKEINKTQFKNLCIYFFET
jgi:hypothetical protein